MRKTCMTAVLLAMLAALGFSSPAAAGEVWLAGVDPVVAADRHGGIEVANDFMALFQPNAPWQRAAARVQVLKVSTQFLHRASDEQLAAMIRDLKRRHIALALEAEILVATVACGNGVPGYTTEAVIRKAAQRVSALGGTINYVAFDEPMTWGHFAKHGAACGYSVDEVVHNIAPNIRTLKTVFPTVRFGDIEPVTNQTADRLDAIMEFATRFEQVTGDPLTFLQADIIWQDQWQPQLAVWRQRAHAAGMAFGVIVDGDPSDRSDTAWTDHAIERYRLVTGRAELRPDDVVIQSWQSRPTHFLPEDAPGTLTSVVLGTVAPPP